MKTSARVFPAALTAAVAVGVLAAGLSTTAEATGAPALPREAQGAEAGASQAGAVTGRSQLAAFASPAGFGPAAAVAAGFGLPLGDADLVETRSYETLAKGVTLTRIVRGTEPATADQINTTTRGPWVVSVLTIDPKKAKGHLQTTYGPDLARVEKTSDLVKAAGALAGVNASFFTFTADPTYPGDPVGLGISDGKLLSEPLTDPTEANLLIDAKSNKMLTGHLTWSGTVSSKRDKLTLEYVNHPPVVPATCTTLPDPTACAAAGDTTLFTPEFAATTPAGAGIEVVLNSKGCVVRTSNLRGTALAAGQTAIQATGADTNALLKVAGEGNCLRTDLQVADASGAKVPLRKGLYGATGRYQLTRNGEVVVPPGTGSFFDRNPRTIAGTTSDGKIVLAALDGRQTTSVGTTMDETAAVAQSLGLTNSLNLDGGGSTAMALQDGTLVNHPSGTNGAERAVGDALVWVPTH